MLDAYERRPKESSTHQKPSKIHSYQCGKGGSTLDIALDWAVKLKLDVLRMQEAWWSGRTKSYPYLDLLIPFGGASIRPREITYIRKDPKKICGIQIFSHHSATGDYCWVELNEVTFLNVYKALQDPTVSQLLLKWTPSAKTISAGNFNSVYRAR